MAQVVAWTTSKCYKCVHFYVSKLIIEEIRPEIAWLLCFWVIKAYSFSKPSRLHWQLGSCWYYKQSSLFQIFMQFNMNWALFLALFGIWEYCHRHNLTDVTSVALLTASALTSPDRSNKIDTQETRLTQDLTPEDQTQINELHSEIVISLQHHLNKISPCRNSFAKGNF